MWTNRRSRCCKWPPHCLPMLGLLRTKARPSPTLRVMRCITTDNHTLIQQSTQESEAALSNLIRSRSAGYRVRQHRWPTSTPQARGSHVRAWSRPEADAKLSGRCINALATVCELVAPCASAPYPLLSVG